MIVRQEHEVIGIHRKGHNVSEVMKYIDGAWRMVWQAIRALFFTRDGAYIETRDGKIFDTKQK